MIALSQIKQFDNVLRINVNLYLTNKYTVITAISYPYFKDHVFRGTIIVTRFIRTSKISLINLLLSRYHYRGLGSCLVKNNMSNDFIGTLYALIKSVFNFIIYFVYMLGRICILIYLYLSTYVIVFLSFIDPFVPDLSKARERRR